MKAIILVAGYATRLYPLTIDKPKALLPVQGKPIINYIIEQIDTVPMIDGIYVVSNHKFADQFNEWADGMKSNGAIKVIDDGTTDEDNRRGAIGDIFFTLERENVAEDICVIAGDNLFTFPLLNYYRFFEGRKADCVCVKTLSETNMLKQFAVAVLDQDGKILHLEEKPQNPQSNIAVYASYFYQKETLPLFRQYLEEGNNPDQPGHFPQWLYTRKDVYAYLMEGECYDIGTPEMYEDVQKISFE